MKSQHLNDTLDPRYNTVTGLTNTTFDSSNIVEDRMATEAQIQQLHERINSAEQRINECCRDLILWETHTQIVRMNSNTRDNNSGILSSGGSVIETFDDNITLGNARRGLPYTVTFAKKWDENLYANDSVAVVQNNCVSATQKNTYYNVSPNFTIYSITHDVILLPPVLCYGGTGANNNRLLLGGFWTRTTTKNVNDQLGGYVINKSASGSETENWGSFVKNIADDGTVTIRDMRRSEAFNIIYYWTQWILRECADGSIIEDITSP